MVMTMSPDCTPASQAGESSSGLTICRRLSSGSICTSAPMPLKLPETCLLKSSNSSLVMYAVYGSLRASIIPLTPPSSRSWLSGSSTYSRSRSWRRVTKRSISSKASAERAHVGRSATVRTRATAARERLVASF